MKIAINAVSAKRGGAVTYLQNMLSVLGGRLQERGGGQIVVWRPDGQTADERWPQDVVYREAGSATGGAGAVGSTFSRLWFDQVVMPRTMKREGFDVLFSSANFGPLHVSTRHVVLVRNPIHFDPVYLQRMRSATVRARHVAQRWLILQCVERADAVLFPSRAMQDLVALYTGRVGSHWYIAPYGTRHDLLHRGEATQHAPSSERAVRLLNVSLYSDQKNLGTLLAATEELQRRTPERYNLRLTAGFHQEWMASSPHFPAYVSEREQFRKLAAIGVAEDVGWRRYGSLGEIYRASDIFVFPSYTESFGHPLVEAMAVGLPIVAADMPCNREICEDAAIYFPAFDARACADAIERVAGDSKLAAALSDRAVARAQDFTWERHVDVLLKALDPSG